GRAGPLERVGEMDRASGGERDERDGGGVRCRAGQGDAGGRGGGDGGAGGRAAPLRCGDAAAREGVRAGARERAGALTVRIVGSWFSRAAVGPIVRPLYRGLAIAASGRSTQRGWV